MVCTLKVPSELMLLLPPAMLRIRPMVMRSWTRRKWMALRGKVLVSLIESMLGEFYQSLVKGKGREREGEREWMESITIGKEGRVLLEARVKCPQSLV